MPTNTLALTRLLIAERPSLLRRMVSIVGSEPAAEDVAQALWLKIQRVEDDPPIVNKRSFLFRLASNLAIDHLRLERRRNTLFIDDGAAATIAAQEPDAETRLLDMEKLRLLDAAVATMPMRCRQVFMLIKVDERSIPETAAELGISEDMVRKHIRHALVLAHAAVYGAADA